MFPDKVTNINPSRWEEKRDEFIEKMKAIPVKEKESSEDGVVTADVVPAPKASIASSVYYKGKGSYEITFTNQGSETAEGLSIEFDDVDGTFLMIERELFPVEILKPGRSFQIHAMMTEGAPHKMMSHVKWQEAGVEFSEDELVLFNH